MTLPLVIAIVAIILLGGSCLCFAIACIAEITDIHRRLFVLETKEQKGEKK